MTSYRVYFRTDLQWGMRKIAARNAGQALRLGRRFAKDKPDSLDLDYFDAWDCPINDIEVCDEHGNTLAQWQDEDLRLQLAARDLLDAAEKVVARWERGDLAAAVRELDATIAKAKEGAG